MKKLTGNQSKLDLNKNGKLDSNDFKMLRSKKGNGGGTSIKEIVEIKGHNIKHIKNSYDDYWYFVYDSTPFEFETKEDAIKSLNDLIKKHKYGNGGGTGVSSETGYAVGTNSDLLMNQDYLAYAEGGVTKSEFMDKIKKAMKEKNKWHFIQDSVEGNSISIKMYVGNKEVDVQRFIVNGLHGGLKKNYQGVMATTKMIDEFVNNLSKKEYANGGSLADTPESFPSTDAMSYGDGGSTSGWCYSIGGL